MAKAPTEKSRYPSKYAPKGWVTAAQYIVELICEKKALSEGRALSVQFWQNKEWATYFKSQTNTANTLLKKYNPKAIIKALNDRRTYKTYSLRAPWLIPLFEEYQRKIQLEDAALESKPPVEAKSDVKFRTTRPAFKKNILSTLRDFDGEEEVSE